MSGGHFNYSNDRCCKEIFGWSFTPDYGDRGISQSEAARKLDPLEDKVISELVWDVFCFMGWDDDRRRRGNVFHKQKSRK